MRTLDIGKIGRDLTVLLEEDDPVDEDIGIVRKDGNSIGVIIKKDVYDFFHTESRRRGRSLRSANSRRVS